MLRKDPSKALQIGFVVLLIVSVAQVAWWMAESVSHARGVQRRIEALYTAESEGLSQLTIDPPTRAAFEQLLPHLDLDSDPPRVDRQALAALEEEAVSRINRFLWEGGFFLLVLLGGIAVLTRAIRHDAELRRRQQNLLAAVSHEFKSPLASMRLSAETLELRASDPDTRRLARRLLADGDRLLRMVDNLLETTRLEETAQPLAVETLELAPLVRSCVDEAQNRAAEHQIRIDAEVPEGLYVAADRSALATVLRNLIDNAVKSCIAHGGKLIRIQAAAAGEVELRVSDDGVGFEPEYGAMLFEKFYRLGDEIRRSTPGTGLGLYIVRRLVDRSGARIRALSDGPGRGATFILNWPAGERE